MPFVQLSRVRLHCHKHGSGPEVVRFVHDSQAAEPGLCADGARREDSPGS